jgi:hypothetical protein
LQGVSQPRLVGLLKNHPTLLECKIYPPFGYPTKRGHTNRQKITTNIPPMSPRYKDLRKDSVSF